MQFKYGNLLDIIYKIKKEIKKNFFGNKFYIT